MSDIIKLVPEVEVEVEVDTSADDVLQEAIGELEVVLVLGITKDQFEHFSSNTTDVHETLWILERAKKVLMESVES